jgi:uncharacterized protein YebE (UPF0316 family)
MELVSDLLIIFSLRLADVAMATVRIVLLARGRKWGATGLGFAESLVWVLAISRVLSGLDDPARMVAFAAGFAAGTFLGAKVEEWLALGQSLVRIVAPIDTPGVAGLLREKGFGATVLNGDGLEGEVRVTFSVIPRKQVGKVLPMVHQANPEAFVTVDQTSSIEAPMRRERDVRK